ncbi:MAG: DegT/DnrJ/EryC1/StrS family aminotransferase [Polyangiaceae bacterium]
MLRIKLPRLEGWTTARRRNAARYDELLSAAALPADLLTLPRRVEQGHVWNQYVIRSTRRDVLRERLASCGIASEIYYPMPLHRQACFAQLDARPPSLPVTERACAEALALPVFPELGEGRLARVADAVLECLRDG